MLFASWQLKATVSVILLTLCLGQELFRTCGQNECFERSNKRQRFEIEQSRQLSRERIFENQMDQSFKETFGDYRIRREATAGYRAKEGDKVNDRYEPFGRSQDFSTRQESRRCIDDKSDGNREKNVYASGRLHEKTHEHISNTGLENKLRHRRCDSRQEYLLLQEYKIPLTDSRQGKHENVLNRVDEATNDRISDRHYRSTREERNTKLDEGRCLRSDSRELLVPIEQNNEGNRQRQVLRQIGSIRFDSRAAGKPLDPIIRERHNDLEFRRKTEGVETGVFRRSSDDHNTQRDISHYNGNLLAASQPVSRRTTSSRSSGSTSQRRSVLYSNTIRAFMNNFQRFQENLRANDVLLNGSELEKRLLDEKSQQRRQSREISAGTSFGLNGDIRKTRDRNNNSYQQVSNRLPESEFRREYRDIKRKDPYEKVPERTNPVTKKRHLFVENSRGHTMPGLTEQRIIISLQDEYENHQREFETYGNNDVSESMGKYTDDRRIERKIQTKVNVRSTSYYRDVAQRSAAVDWQVLQEMQRLILTTSERNERGISGYGDYNVDSRVNDLRHDKWLLKRRNSFDIEPNKRFRNTRFTDEEQRPPVLHLFSYTTLGQVFLFVYVLMRNCNGKNLLNKHLQAKLHDTLGVVGF